MRLFPTVAVAAAGLITLTPAFGQLKKPQKPQLAARVAQTPSAALAPAALPYTVPTPTPLPLSMFPFALPPFDDAKTAIDVSWLSPTPAGSGGFLRAAGEHFVDRQGKIVRLWGVNMNFEGVFPAKQEAPRIAARLAKFGFNAVRLHHFEGYPAPRGIWKAATIGSSRLKLPREIDPDQLDRLDFFISELIKRGVYIDLNLHVARKVQEAEGFANAAALPEKDKGVNFYEDRLVAMQQDFARTLLTHLNPYTTRALKDEPGLAAIEVSNENSLLGMWLDGTLSKVPDDYTPFLREGWNKWLRLKYASESSLHNAWTEANVPLGQDDLLAQPPPIDVINPFAPDARLKIGLQTLGQMQLATVTGAQGILAVEAASGPTIDNFARPGLSATLQTAGTVSWAFQINRDHLDLKEGQPYTLSFWARADTPRRISVNLWQDQEPNRFEGFTGYADLTADWKQFTYVFRPVNPDPEHSRLSWNLGNQVGKVQLGEVTLRTGGRIAAPEDWTLSEGVPLVDFKTMPVVAARRDFAEYLGTVERDHINRMRVFLQGTGVRCPMWQTQAQFGGWGGVWRESRSDAIDLHAYWKHPDFGGNGWNGSSWKVENASMTVAPASDPLSAFNLFRVAGKPFVLSEWNSGQPNDFGGESLLMVAAYAAWQDWAGVFLFDYHSSGAYDRDHFEGFFSIDSHPVKMATLPAAALLFRRPAPHATMPDALPGDLTMAQDDITLSVPADSIWQEVANAPGGPTAAPIIKTWGMAGVARGAALDRKTYVRFEDGPFPVASRAELDSDSLFASDTRELRWTKNPGLFTINTARSKAAIGFAGGQTLNLDELRITMPPSQNNFAAFALSSLDGLETPRSNKLLLTVAGRAENIGMGYNAERTTVGNNWGSGPTQVEGITAEVQVLTNAKQAHVYALDTTGARRVEVPSTLKDGALKFSPSPQWQTLWYEISAG